MMNRPGNWNFILSQCLNDMHCVFIWNARVLDRSKLLVSTHPKRSFEFASRLRSDYEICLLVKSGLQEHLEKDITKFPMGIFCQ